MAHILAQFTPRFNPTMKKTPIRSHRHPRGFTLIELLTVVAIIAILVAGAFSGYGHIVERVKKRVCQTNTIAIQRAIDQFYNDYSKLPQPSTGGGGSSDVECDTSTEEGLVEVLAGREPTSGERVQNPRGIDYLDGFKPAKPPRTDTGKWTDGLVYEEGKIEIVDPWGNYYKIHLDLDYDNEIDNPNDQEAQKGRRRLRARAIVYSYGKDGQQDTWNDNVQSWE